mgnify:CR=1 FL=1
MKRLPIVLIGHGSDEILPGEKAALAKLFKNEGGIEKDEDLWYVRFDPNNQKEFTLLCERFNATDVFLNSNIKTRLPWLETIDGIRHLFVSATDIYEVFIFGKDNAPVLREISMHIPMERLVPIEV